MYIVSFFIILRLYYTFKTEKIDKERQRKREIYIYIIIWKERERGIFNGERNKEKDKKKG